MNVTHPLSATIGREMGRTDAQAEEAKSIAKRGPQAEPETDNPQGTQGTHEQTKQARSGRRKNIMCRSRRLIAKCMRTSRRRGPTGGKKNWFAAELAKFLALAPKEDVRHAGGTPAQDNQVGTVRTCTKIVYPGERSGVSRAMRTRNRGLKFVAALARVRETLAPCDASRLGKVPRVPTSAATRSTPRVCIPTAKSRRTPPVDRDQLPAA